jgi:hypothetical protein
MVTGINVRGAVAQERESPHRQFPGIVFI